MAEITTKDLWEPFLIVEDTLVTKTIGDLNLWCRLVEKKIQIAHSHKTENAGIRDLEFLPAGTVWSRWSLAFETPVIKLVPMFPDRPLVVKPEESFRLVKDVQTRINARVPIWVGIDVVQGDSTVRLVEIPTAVLSKTWFGTFTEGEACYWISSGLRNKIEPDPLRPFQAICPIQLVNSSDEELLIEKICLRVVNLALFFDGDQLWSDETRIVFKGKDEISDISVSAKPPSEAPDAVRMMEPRSPMKKGFTAQTFATLKDLPGLGVAFR